TVRMTGHYSPRRSAIGRMADPVTLPPNLTHAVGRRTGGERTMAIDYPLIVSADDHIVEPPDVWTARVPRKYHDCCPRVVRQEIADMARVTLDVEVEQTEAGRWAGVWHYEDKRFPLMLGAAAAGFPRNQIAMRATTFDEIRPGCWKPSERLSDMDIAGVEAQVCFPNMQPVRFG